jgi:two-component system response regulator GlrR
VTTDAARSTRGKVLIVDDDPDLLRLMCMRVQAAGYTPVGANNATEALAAVDTHAPLTMVTDLRMEGMDGLGLYEAVHRDNPLLPVIIITAHGTIPDAVDATRRGVFAFLTKPFDGRELIEHIERAIAIARPAEHTAPGAGPGARMEWARGIVTQNPRMLALLDHIARIADTDVSVLVQGPAGAGKQQLAEAIHRASRRRDAPFAELRCGTTAEAQLEQTLFGQAPDAFASSPRALPGVLDTAAGGTLLLDEVDALPVALQAKLARVLEAGRVPAPGDVTGARSSADDAAIDVRIIATTRVDLEHAVADGDFRADLFYRLGVARLVVPALDERREDIPALVRHRLQQLKEQATTAAEAFTPAAMELLMAAPWPGNLRQLFNVVDHCHALATAKLIPADLTSSVLAVRDRPPAIESLEAARARFDQEYLVKLMKMTGGNVARAAQLSGRNRTDLYKLLRRHGIDPTSYKLD